MPSPDPRALFGEAESASELLGLLAGAASVCWSDPGGAGVFESERASVLVDAALDRLVELGWFGPRAIPPSPEQNTDQDRCTWTEADDDGYQWRCLLDIDHEDDHLTAPDIARLQDTDA